MGGLEQLSRITLLAWGAAMIYIHASGRVVDLLHPMFRPYVLIAGIVLVVLGILHVVLVRKEICCDENGCVHGGQQAPVAKILSFLVLVGSVSAALAFSPEDFSANLIQNRGFVESVASLPGSEPSFLPTNEQGHLEAEVVDLVFATQDDIIRSDFADKTIVLVGQTMPATENNSEGKRVRLVRMFMTCCAADVRPVSIFAEGEGVAQFPDMTWVKVVGKATFPTENGRTIAVVKTESIEQTDPPEESMLY